jgi:two-component system sensor kinase FixL
VDSAGVEITVTDTGPGLPAEIREKIFEPFVTSKESGTGIGLSISRTIIEAHHGQIRADSHPDGGAVFSVTLPTDADGS